MRIEIYTEEEFLDDFTDSEFLEMLHTEKGVSEVYIYDANTQVEIWSAFLHFAQGELITTEGHADKGEDKGEKKNE